MKKFKSKIKKWIFSHLLKRYLVSVDDKFLDLITKKNIDVNIHFGNEYARQEYEKIMKILSSSKYKEFFYKVVNHKLDSENKVTVKPYGKNIVDRILKFIASSYLYFFDRKLYDSVELYAKWKDKIAKINAKADEYMAKTTVQERIDRCVEIGILSKDASEKLKDDDDFSKPIEPTNQAKDSSGKILHTPYENVIPKPKRKYNKKKDV